MNFFRNQSPPPPPPPPPTPRPRRVRLPKLILPLSFHLPVSTLPLLPVTTAALALTSTLLPRSRWNLLQFIISISTLPTPIPFLHFLRPLFLPLLATKAYSLLTRLFFPTHDRTLCFWRRALPIYAAYKTTQAQLSIRAPPLADSTKAWNSRHTWAAARVYALCTELRGFYLKDGQYLGTRTDVVPQAWCLVLRTLQDRVPQIPFHEVEQTIKDAYCINQLPQVFQSIHTVPLASATIAQVHRATMPNGSPVVIKAQYCDQQQLYEKDLRNLRRLGRFLQSHKVPFFDMACVMGEFEKRIPLEFDFLREAEMMTTIRLNLKRAGINDIVIPKLVPGLVSQRVLTMSFIEGCRPDNSVAMNLWGIVPKDVVKTVGRAYGQMLLCDGVAHCDRKFAPCF